jgi:hypothetical protein
MLKVWFVGLDNSGRAEYGYLSSIALLASIRNIGPLYGVGRKSKMVWSRSGHI